MREFAGSLAAVQSAGFEFLGGSAERVRGAPLRAAQQIKDDIDPGR